MEKKEMLYEGKAKKVYTTEDPDVLIVSYKDDATAFNGQKKGTIVGKGAINNRMTNFIFKKLEAQGVLNPGESWCEIDVEAQERWMASQGVDTSSMTEQEIREYQTGSWVFIRAGGRLVDAMEDFAVAVDCLSDLLAA